MARIYSGVDRNTFFAITFFLWGLSFAVTKGLFEQIVGAWLERQQDRLLEPLTCVVPCEIPVLAAHFSLDEAGLGLRASHYASEIMPKLTRLFAILTSVLLVTIPFQFTLGVLVWLLGSIFDWNLSAIEGLYGIMWPYSFLALAICFQVFLVFQILSLVLPWIIRGHGFGFGFENPLGAVLVNLRVQDRPVDAAVEVKSYSLREFVNSISGSVNTKVSAFFEFRHSYIYKYPTAIEDMGAWIDNCRSNSRAGGSTV